MKCPWNSASAYRKTSIRGLPVDVTGANFKRLQPPLYRSPSFSPTGFSHNHGYPLARVKLPKKKIYFKILRHSHSGSRAVGNHCANSGL